MLKQTVQRKTILKLTITAQNIVEKTVLRITMFLNCTAQTLIKIFKTYLKIVF